MKTRKLVLAKPGIYGTVENPTVVTEKDLKEIAQTFPSISKAPISLTGHWPDPSAPRFGNVISVTWDDVAKDLGGEVEEQDVLAKVVEEGFYPDWSIGSRRRASDGMMYLHHLAYLGEEPPAIKDLKEQIAKDLSANPLPPDSIAAGDEGEVSLIIPPIRTRLNLSDSTKPTPKEGKRKMTLDEALAALETEKTKNLELSDSLKKKDATLAALAGKYPEEEILLSDADPRTKHLLGELRKGKVDAVISAASGKIPAGKLPVLRTLAESLTATNVIELSDGETRTKVSSVELLGKVIDTIPKQVVAGRLDLSDTAGAGATIRGRDALKNF